MRRGNIGSDTRETRSTPNPSFSMSDGILRDHPTIESHAPGIGWVGREILFEGFVRPAGLSRTVPPGRSHAINTRFSVYSGGVRGERDRTLRTDAAGREATRIRRLADRAGWTRDGEGGSRGEAEADGAGKLAAPDPGTGQMSSAPNPERPDTSLQHAASTRRAGPCPAAIAMTVPEARGPISRREAPCVDRIGQAPRLQRLCGLFLRARPTGWRARCLARDRVGWAPSSVHEPILPELSPL